ncbi:hypothetical protein OE88DRAFT_1760080, partial [Heliocybe sulcata]
WGTSPPQSLLLRHRRIPALAAVPLLPRLLKRAVRVVMQRRLSPLLPRLCLLIKRLRPPALLAPWGQESWVNLPLHHRKRGLETLSLLTLLYLRPSDSVPVYQSYPVRIRRRRRSRPSRAWSAGSLVSEACRRATATRWGEATGTSEEQHVVRYCV